MAKKLILLPMDLYKGLIETKKDTVDHDLKERAPLQYESAQLKKLKRKPRKNVSTKNVLYNQQLRRYLRARNEAKSKPVKVQVENAQLIAKPDEKTKGNVQAAIIGDDENLEEVFMEDKTPSVRYSNSSDGVYTSPNGSSSSRKTSRSTFESVTSVKPITPKKPTPPSKSYPKRESRAIATEKKKDAEKKEKLLVNIIMMSPEKFGVNTEGRIINPKTGNPIANSNINWVVNRLVDPEKHEAGSPPGMKILKKNVLSDENAKQLVHPKHFQIGRGKHKIISKEQMFRPSQWRK